MKAVSKISLCLVIVFMLSVLVSCTYSDNKLEGTYSGKYMYDGSEIYVVITLDENGQYTKDTTIDGQTSPSTSGDYELKDGKVRLYSSTDHKSWIAYNYVDGHLENDYGKFTKKIIINNRKILRDILTRRIFVYGL